MAASRGTATLRIVGDGPARPYLESLVRLRGLEDRVTFTGHVDAGQVAAEYRHGDLFVMPSLWEGLPHVLLEAMASGLPIAISDIDAAKGIVEPEYGWILPTRSSAPWTALFDRLESDPTPLAEMGPRARKAAVAWADWDHITDRVELTLRGLCDCVG
jgi:glycosyltransferase involved in cell wall biosynthesis